MCLFVKGKQKIAKRDIRVYKVLFVADGKTYKTPVQRTLVPKNGVMIPDTNTTNRDISVFRDDTGRYGDEVHGGVIHALRFKVALSEWSRTMYAVAFEATIPEGTKYIIGQDKDICATKLVVHFDKPVKIKRKRRY